MGGKRSQLLLGKEVTATRMPGPRSSWQTIAYQFKNPGRVRAW